MPRPRHLVAAVLVLVVAGGAFWWLRDSSLVAVKRVRVLGVSGPDAAQIRSALQTVAHNMSTLDVNLGELRTAVAPYPVVKHLEVSTQFPHAMSIRVVEQVPVGVVQAAGRRISVSGDGTLLHDIPASSSLPVISLSVVPGGSRLTGYARDEAQLLGAAPYQLLTRLSDVSDSGTQGLTAQLRNGPTLVFGGHAQLAAKWSAAVSVLANGGSAGASYVDITDPNRPAAGGGSDSISSTAQGSGGSG
jgi:cell division protein FtsQ